MADGPDFASNPCCALWKDKYSKFQNKYSKMEEGRAALRRGIELYGRQNTQMQSQIDTLKKAYDELKLHAKNELKEKEKESSTRLSLENEVSALKSEILSLHHKERAEVQCLKGELTRVNEELIRVKEELKLVSQFDGQAEMNQLKDQLQEAITQKRKAEEKKKRVDVTFKIAEDEISSLKSQILCLQQREEALLKERAEVQCLKGELTRVDEELIRVKEELKLVSQFDGQAEMNQLKDQLQEAITQKRKAEEKKKRVDVTFKIAKDEISSLKSQILCLQQREEALLEEKAHADKLSQQLEESRQMIEDLRKQRLVLVSPERLDAPPAGINMSVETAKMKLLKQELKLEKRQVKHAKQVVKLEKGQRKILQQELSRIKTELKLLDLDDAVDEDRYLLAIQKPLSPSLPDIEIKDSVTVETDDFNPSNGRNTEQLSNLNDSMVQICNFDTMNGDIDSNKSKLGDMDSSKSTSMHAFISRVNTIQDSSMKRGISDVGNKGSTILCGSKFVHTDDSPQHSVVFSSIIESCSLSKIYCTMRSLKNHCLFSLTTIAVQNLMSALVEVDNLLPKEKVCVFFSLLLNNCCWYFKDVVDGDFIHFLNFSIGHMMKVMSDVETRRILFELCILDELITLIEEFLIERRVLVHSDGYAAPSVRSDRRVNIIQDNGDTSLSFQTASPYQLVCGAITLASLCAAYDRIGFLCEASYNVARIRKLDSSVLTTLHVFSNICGSEYFSLSGYSLIMDVMKSLVTFKENECRSTGFASFHQVMPLEWSDFPLCTDCPFLEGAVSLNVLTSRLLEKLLSCSRLHKFGLLTCQFKADFDGTSCDVDDIVSLLELVAFNMSWDWTCDNIIVQLLVILESHLLESALAAGLILLGQLARIGINANGSGDSKVEKIRGKYCAFLSESTLSKVSLSIQIVAVSGLLGMMSLSFEEVIARNMEELPEVDCIRKWFSLLSNEDKSLAYTTLKC